VKVSQVESETEHMIQMQFVYEKQIQSCEVTGAFNSMVADD